MKKLHNLQIISKLVVVKHLTTISSAYVATS